MHQPAHLLLALVGFITCQAASAQATAAAPDVDATRRIVYLFAGQSNTSRLGSRSCPSAPSLPSNVKWLIGTTPAAHSGLFDFASAVGAAHYPSTVLIGMAAFEGSALLERNSHPSWFPAQLPYWFGGPNELLANSVANAALILSQGPVDELHIVWGQGESDCISANPAMPTFDYWAGVQFVTGAIAAPIGLPTYTVHLVTIGSIDIPPTAAPGSPYQDPTDVDQIRDAYFALDRVPPLTLPWPVNPTYRSVAHHYDLPHLDEYHLQNCEYRSLARRIADGIIFPSARARVNGTTLPSPNLTTNIINIPTTTPLDPYTGGTNHFRILHNGANLPVQSITTSGSNIVVQLATGTTFASGDTLSVRYIHGSGYNQNWATLTPIRSVAAGAAGKRVLEPFVLSRTF